MPSGLQQTENRERTKWPTSGAALRAPALGMIRTRRDSLEIEPGAELELASAVQRPGSGPRPCRRLVMGLDNRCYESSKPPTILVQHSCTRSCLHR